MERNARNKKALSIASQNADKAIAVLDAVEYKHYPAIEKEAWAMAALIHCDICRLTIALDECEGTTATLLSFADIVSKLHEAMVWYTGRGSKNLRAIAKSKSCGLATLDSRLKELKIEHKIGDIDKYSKYRNKIGYHYDAETLKYLHNFGQEDSETLTTLLMTFVKYSGSWADLTRELIQNKL